MTEKKKAKVTKASAVELDEKELDDVQGGGTFQEVEIHVKTVDRTRKLDGDKKFASSAGGSPNV